MNMSKIVDLQERRATIASEEARQRFGRWDDWSADDIRYLLQELSDGHWEDCGEKVPGFAIATGGLNMAIAANRGEHDSDSLRLIVNGMWVAADYLSCVDEVYAHPHIAASLEAVWNACKWSGEPGGDAAGITFCPPPLR
jgi:hypothetical protein